MGRRSLTEEETEEASEEASESEDREGVPEEEATASKQEAAASKADEEAAPSKAPETKVPSLDEHTEEWPRQEEEEGWEEGKKEKRKQNQKEAAEDEKEEKGKEEEAKQKEEKGKQKGRDEPSQKCTMVRPGARHAQARRREAREARRREDAKARRREGAKARRREARRREGAKGRSRATQVACNNYNGVKQARSKTQSKARQAVAKQKQVFLNGFRKSCETYSCDHPALWSTGAYRCATRRNVIAQRCDILHSSGLPVVGSSEIRESNLSLATDQSIHDAMAKLAEKKLSLNAADFSKWQQATGWT
eukprot:s2681_g10.t2